MRLLLIVFSLMLIVASCNKSNEKENKICFSRTLTGLRIENNTNTEFYFSAFSQTSLALIYWFPVCGNNNITPNNSINVDDSSDDLLVVYWWECNGNDPGEMKSVTLDKKQSVCQ